MRLSLTMDMRFGWRLEDVNDKQEIRQDDDKNASVVAGPVLLGIRDKKG